MIKMTNVQDVGHQQGREAAKISRIAPRTKVEPKAVTVNSAVAGSGR
jgi:hypothetical protein